MKFIDKLQNFIKYGIYIWRIARPTQLAAALAYYGMMSLPPLLLVMYTFGWYFLEDFLLANRVVLSAGQIVGPQVEALLNEAMLSAIPNSFGGSGLWAVIGILLLLLAASGLFLDLQSALNRIWEAPPSKHIGPVDFIQRRFVAILMLIGFAAILILPMRLEYELFRLETEIGLKLPVRDIETPLIFLFFIIALATLVSPKWG